MIAAISSDASPSARMKPVVMIRTPAIAVNTNAARSVRMCWKAPSIFIEARLARERMAVAARLTAIPATATAATVAPPTRAGSISRLMPS